MVGKQKPCVNEWSTVHVEVPGADMEVGLLGKKTGVASQVHT